MARTRSPFRGSTKDTGHSHIICVDGRGRGHSGLVGPVSIATGDVLCRPMWSAG